ncbi:hypothetical protein SAMN06265355_13113 [Actinomadura mexicana]|uniref:Uncharacterized protein n=1 Tax=Actinomadura mexicana TaxID=134959 RepID=A0A239HGT9_9ACTN|nr:hypothetical protein SAMN06265355_13113 [Actinomadura mexicana]
MSDQRTSSGGTATTSTKGMYGKGLPHGGEDRKGKGKGK